LTADCVDLEGQLAISGEGEGILGEGEQSLLRRPNAPETPEQRPLHFREDCEGHTVALKISFSS
jgi:hypothetical protein